MKSQVVSGQRDNEATDWHLRRTPAADRHLARLLNRTQSGRCRQRPSRRASMHLAKAKEGS